MQQPCSRVPHLWLQVRHHLRWVVGRYRLLRGLSPDVLTLGPPPVGSPCLLSLLGKILAHRRWSCLVALGLCSQELEDLWLQRLRLRGCAGPKGWYAAYTYIYIYIYVYRYVYMFICMCMYRYIYIYVCLFVCLSVCLHVCTCVLMIVYM